jgi:hypothetical protein
LVHLTPRSGASESPDIRQISALSPLSPPGYAGHAHFWERALSRRQLVRTAAGASALAVGASMGWPAAAFASHSSNDDPKPIPGGTDLLALLGQGSGPLFHFFFPAFGEDTSTITDFKGSIAAAEIQGTGLATPGGTLTYDADMRFMRGEYVAVDGRHRQGTFGFV